MCVYVCVCGVGDGKCAPTIGPQSLVTFEPTQIGRKHMNLGWVFIRVKVQKHLLDRLKFGPKIGLELVFWFLKCRKSNY